MRVLGDKFQDFSGLSESDKFNELLLFVEAYTELGQLSSDATELLTEALATLVTGFKLVSGDTGSKERNK